MYQPKTSRDLLTDLGVGRFNATMLIETLMMAPATTEAGSAPVMVLVQHIQAVLQQLAPKAGISATGVIDRPTDIVMRQICGDDWLYRTWFDVTRMVVSAKQKGTRINVETLQSAAPAEPQLAGLGFLDLPDVPGGLVTYGVVGFLLYRAFKKKR